MKAKVLILIAAAMLMIAPSCTKQKGKWVKHTVTEEYVYADQEEDEITQENAPKLWGWKAKSLVKKALKEKEIINTPTILTMPIGYFECNDQDIREALYKTQVNGLINVTYSEIQNKYNKSTYWVDVALTPEGQALIVENDMSDVFPEDTITRTHMLSIISPNTGKNQYGEYTFDQNVDSTIIKLIENFYNAYVTDKEDAINRFGTQDLINAQSRVLSAKELGINRILQDPFLRRPADASHVDSIAIVKWTEYIDLYIAEVNEQEYCIVVKEENGTKKIDDIALNAPNYLKNNKTLRCVALGISAKELHNAQLRKNKADEAKAKAAAKKKTTKKTTKKEIEEEEEFEEEEIEESLLWDEYEPNLAPGIVEVERTEPTLYDLAKEVENEEEVNLLAGDFKFKKLSKIHNAKKGQYDIPTKTAIVVVERTKVSPLGRIFFNMKEKEKVSYDVIFYYENEEWNCRIID